MDNGNIDPSLKQPTPSLFNQIDVAFQELNEQQAKLISLIQEKLHSVINKTNEGDSGNKQLDPQMPISLDFQSCIKNRLSDLRMNTTKLNQVLAHLNEIV
jgi:hypothetical protein